MSENIHGTALIIIIYFFHFPPTSIDLHPLQVENCDSNSRLVVDEDDNGKFRLERVNGKLFHVKYAYGGLVYYISLLDHCY